MTRLLLQRSCLKDDFETEAEMLFIVFYLYHVLDNLKAGGLLAYQ